MQLVLRAPVSPATHLVIARSSVRSSALLRKAPARRQDASGRGKLAARAGKVELISAEELEVAIATREKPLVIDFFASWCGPCVLMAAELEKVAEELGDAVRIVKIDTEAEPELSSQLQIQGLPTLVFVPAAKDKPALRAEGLLPAATVKKIIADECS